MSINNITGNVGQAGAYGTGSAGKNSNKKPDKQANNQNLGTDSVEIGSSQPSKLYKPDINQLNKLWAQVNEQTQPLRDMVEKLFAQSRDNFAHGANFAKAAKGEATVDLSKFFGVHGKGNGSHDIEVDAETQAKAQELISDDGFWGAPQTAQRILDFAGALSGGDSEAADALMSAVEKSFNQVAKMFGGYDKLPDVTKRTYDLVKEGFAKWKETGSLEPVGTAASEDQ